MNLKTFDSTTCRGRRMIDPEIRFSKSGVITFNVKLAEQMNLKPGDTVVFHQDQVRKRDWYIEKSKTNGLELRCSSATKNRSLVMNASLVCKELFASLGIAGPVRLSVATQTTDGKYWAILTAKNA